MHKVSLAIATLGVSASLLAQNCNQAPPPGRLCTYDPPNASFYYPPSGQNSLTEFFDLNLQTPVAITKIDTTTYAQGAGNPVVPNQVGNIAEARIYMIPGTRVGNEGTAAFANWVHVANAELTVVAYNSYSPIQNFTDPVTGNPLPNNELALDPADPTLFDINGDAGVAIEIIPTTYYQTPLVTTANTGPIPVIGYVDPNTMPTHSDQFMTIDETGIRNNGWWTVDPSTTPANDTVPNASPTGVSTGRPNICLDYTPSASAATWIPSGEGCYNRPQAFYDFLAEATASSSVYINTQWTFIPPNPANVEEYLVIPTGPAYAQPGGSATNVVAGNYTTSSSASWDDACVDQPLGFSFPFPGGSTNTISINSNGLIYLGTHTDTSFAANGSNYGGTNRFQNGPPSGPLAQWSPFNCDLDPSAGGAIYFENPTSTSARITWADVPNWPAVANEICQIQITLYDTGNVEVAFGSLYNSAIGSGNTAILGYSNGNGDPLDPAPESWPSLVGPVGTGNGDIPPILSMDARPVLGTTANVICDNLTAGTNFGIVAASINGTTGSSLAPYGMPGCELYLNPGLVVASFLTPATPQANFSVAFTIPASPSFQNAQFFFQVAPLTPGLNSAGILSSNAVCARLGQ